MLLLECKVKKGHKCTKRGTHCSICPCHVLSTEIWHLKGIRKTPQCLIHCQSIVLLSVVYYQHNIKSSCLTVLMCLKSLLSQNKTRNFLLKHSMAFPLLSIEIQVCQTHCGKCVKHLKLQDDTLNVAPCNSLTTIAITACSCYVCFIQSLNMTDKCFSSF